MLLTSVARRWARFRLSTMYHVAKMSEGVQKCQKQAVHKSGPLKQHNKSHKHGKHKSKGEINSTHKGIWMRAELALLTGFDYTSYIDKIGRVGVKAHSRKGSKELRKADRRNQVCWL